MSLNALLSRPMGLHALLPRQSDCIQCPVAPPTCNCAADETCIQLTRDCATCESVSCVAISPSASIDSQSASSIPQSTSLTSHVASLASPSSSLPASCITCPAAPSCDCADGDQCVLTQRSCTTCATFQCLAASQASNNPGVNAISSNPSSTSSAPSPSNSNSSTASRSASTGSATRRILLGLIGVVVANLVLA
ncbi:hypothetical protein C8R44DRAFT_822445 [Mycena epipterygia]|nr:hypothetical protein C8R44DRAFT_822445 [Mycena epipterygia]